MKKEEIQKFSETEITLPTAVLRDRTLKVLEAIVEYLKETKNFTYHEIAVILNRNDRTIWTVYDRAKKKRDKKHAQR